MRREPEFFGDQDLDLIYIAKRLKDALRLEEVLTQAGLDYLVEPDRYTGGIIFRTERVGAFFYVAPDSGGAARQTMAAAGYKPHALQEPS
jgi:hypothetical protein